MESEMGRSRRYSRKLTRSVGYTYAQHLLGGSSLILQGLQQRKCVGGRLICTNRLGEGLHPGLKFSLVHHLAHKEQWSL